MTRKARLGWTAVAALAVIALAPAASVYYESKGGPGCGRCHEIQPVYKTWHTSTHRKIECSACHGDAATLDAGFHLNNLKRVVEHFRGDVPEQIRMRPVDIPAMLKRCQSCHREEFADWENGPHGVKYSKIFLNADFYRTKMPPMDDCLRCHGAHFAGSIRDLVTPIDRKGPWKIAAGMDNRACDSVHVVPRDSSPGCAAGTARGGRGVGERRTGASVAGVVRPPFHDACRGGEPAVAGDARRGSCSEDESRPAPGALLPVSRGIA